MRYNDAKPVSGSEDIDQFVAVGDDGVKHSTSDSNGGSTAAHRAARSICSGLLDVCGTEGVATELVLAQAISHTPPLVVLILARLLEEA